MLENCCASKMGATSTIYNSGSDLDEKCLNLLGKLLMYAERQIDSRYTVCRN